MIKIAFMRYCILIFGFIWVLQFSSFAQFPLLDIQFEQNDAPLLNPFTGGFTSAQFNNIDLDRDGVNDVVVFDRDGNVVRSFIYNTEQNRLEYRPEYDDLFPELKNFLLVRDYDQDGIEDLFTYSLVPGIAGVSIYKGKILNGQLEWDQVTFPNHRDLIMYKTRNDNFVNAYVSSVDLPAIGDVDGDGDIDLLSFEVGGSRVTYYKNTAVENDYSLDSLTFVLEDQCWGKIYEAEFSEELSLSNDPDECANALTSGGNASPRHAGSTLTLVDLNGDELMDLLIGDLASPNVVALFNGGTKDNAWGVRQETQYPTNDLSIDFPVFISTFLVDVDNDSIQELIAAPNTENAAKNQDNIWLYENLAEKGEGITPEFVKTNFLLDETLDLSGASVPAITDVNQDGLADIVVGTYGYQDQTGQIEPRVFLFTNTGSPENPEFSLADDDYLQLSEYKGNLYFAFAPAFGDLDNDGDEDLLFGNFSGGLFYFENIAGPGKPYEFAEEITDYKNIDVGQFSVPQIIDVNDDGLPDLLIGERNGNSVNGQACGNINYFQNIGNSQDPDFDPEEENAPNDPCFAGVFTREANRLTGYSSPQLLKFSNKTWLLTGSQSLEVLLYEQMGDVFDPYNLLEEQWGGVRQGERTHPRLFDLNNDGNFEMIVGNNRGGLAIYGTPVTTTGEYTATENPELSNMYIFPNPGNNYFMTSVPDVEYLELYDMNGKLLGSYKDTDRIFTGQLTPGTYIISIKTEDETYINKWIKN